MLSQTITSVLLVAVIFLFGVVQTFFFLETRQNTSIGMNGDRAASPSLHHQSIRSPGPQSPKITPLSVNSPPASREDSDPVLLQEAAHEVRTLTKRLGRAFDEVKTYKRSSAANSHHESPRGCASDKEYLWWLSTNPSKTAVANAAGTINNRDATPSPPLPSSQRLRVVNWNLWNLSEQWPLRRQAIASNLRELGAHVVGVQEVRLVGSGGNGGSSSSSSSSDRTTQLEALAKEAGYQHWVYQEAGVKGRRDEEGVGLMSKLPIVSSEAVSIPLSHRSSDLNPRTALKVTIDVSSIVSASSSTPPQEAALFVDVVVTHLSYDAGEQCRQVVFLRRFLDAGLTQVCSSQPQIAVGSSQGVVPPQTLSRGRHRAQVMMGDLNIYRDFEWPMDYLTAADTHALERIQGFTPSSPLASSQQAGPALDTHYVRGRSRPQSRASISSSRVGCTPHRDAEILPPLPPVDSNRSTMLLSGGFVDVWEEAGNAGAGGGESADMVAWTFPNLAGATNDAARCDRILVRSSSSSSSSSSPENGPPSSSSTGHQCVTLVPHRTAVIGCHDIPGVNQLEGHGNDRGTPLRPSDHRAVVADFTLGS